MLITTTPGMLTTDEGIEAFELRNNATEFDEQWYDFSYDRIMSIIASRLAEIRCKELNLKEEVNAENKVYRSIIHEYERLINDLDGKTESFK